MELGKRIKWIRETLDLSPKDVYLSIDMPHYSYYRKEWGCPTEKYADIIKLAQFFDSKWQSKYLELGNFPRYNSEQIKMITPLFLMVGEDYVMNQLLEEMEFMKIFNNGLV